MTVSLVNSSSNANYSNSITDTDEPAKSSKTRKQRGCFNVIKNVALGALAVQGATMAPKADGGPVTYAACVVGCETLALSTTGPVGIAALQACINACLPFLAPPLP